MRLIKRISTALSLFLLAAAVGASPVNPQNGSDFRALEKAVPTDSGKKVEITEFFWYNCPHCNAFEPALSDWVKKQGDNIAFKRVPVAFRDSFVPQQRMYYALEAMGKSEELQKKIFRAIHVERQQLDTEPQIVEFIGKQGIDKQKFTDLYNSFAVQTKVKRAAQLQQDYKIDGVPTVAVAGRYLTSPSIVVASIGNQSEAELQDAALKVMDWLVAKAAKETQPAPAASQQAAPAKETKKAKKSQ